MKGVFLSSTAEGGLSCLALLQAGARFDLVKKVCFTFLTLDVVVVAEGITPLPLSVVIEGVNRLNP